MPDVKDIQEICGRLDRGEQQLAVEGLLEEVDRLGQEGLARRGDVTMGRDDDEGQCHALLAQQGLRGVAGSTRAGNYGRYKDYMARANDEIGLILQIESQEALDNLDAICRVPGVDAVFIGPSDLAASLGYRGQSGHPVVQAPIAQAFKTANAAGKAKVRLRPDNT